MAARKRYSVEEIIAKLREAEKLQSQGLAIPRACKRPVLDWSVGQKTQTRTFYRVSANRLFRDCVDLLGGR